jgi:hypothetical protein
MKLFETLSEDTYVLFAARHYYNPVCIDADEFHEDLKRFKYVKRLVNRHLNGDNLSVRLMLNHLIVVFNVFGIPAGLKMLEYRLNKEEHWQIIKPFLVYLKIIDNDKYTGIEMNQVAIDELRKI